MRDAAAFYLHDRQQVPRSRCDENFRGVLQVRGRQCFFFDAVTRHPIWCSQQSRVTPGRQPELSGGVHTRLPSGGENVRRGAFGDFAALVQQDGLVVTARLGRLQPGQVHAPGENLGARELARRIARSRRVAQPHARRPTPWWRKSARSGRRRGPCRPFPHPPVLRTTTTRRVASKAWFAATNSSNLRRTCSGSGGRGTCSAAASLRMRAQWRSNANNTPSTTRMVLKTPQPESSPTCPGASSLSEASRISSLWRTKRCTGLHSNP